VSSVRFRLGGASTGLWAIVDRRTGKVLRLALDRALAEGLCDDSREVHPAGLLPEDDDARHP
jgi:hypothetical protein